MNKFKTLLLPVLGACALTAQAQDIVNAQDVIDILTANGGHCQTVYYSATYQKDAAHDASWKSTNNMYIKDSFGKAHFVDAHRSQAITDEYGNEVNCRVITLVDAFGGLFDWDLYIDSANYSFYQTNQLSEETYQAKGEGNENKYVRLHMMSAYPEKETPGDNFTEPIKKDEEFELHGNDYVQLWTSFHDIKNFEWIGVTPWGHENFDASLFLAPFMAGRWYFLRLAVKDKGADGEIGTNDDSEDYHYDFYLAEFRHFIPNTVISDNLNDETRSFEAISELNEDTNEFFIYNFSDFGPCFTQPKVSDRGYGDGQTATISPISGQLFDDGTLLVLRQPGYVHYKRGYEYPNGDHFDCSFKEWHDCWTAGVVTDENGNFDPSNLQLQRNITGTWTGGTPSHHHVASETSQATNPWVTDGGTCRTKREITLNLNPYVYCTDDQLATNTYDHKDDTRGGIYKLITANVKDDMTLDLTINSESKNNFFKVVNTNSEFTGNVAFPISFTVNKNAEYVDHYEVYAYKEEKDNNAITDASDDKFREGKLGNLMTAEDAEDTKYISVKNTGAGEYDAFTVKNDAPALFETNKIMYDKILTVPFAETEIANVTLYVKAVYKENTGLAPTYHSLTNIIVNMNDNIVTGIDDLAVKQSVASKVLENGQVFIIKNGVKYNTMGQRVK